MTRCAHRATRAPIACRPGVRAGFGSPLDIAENGIRLLMSYPIRMMEYIYHKKRSQKID